MTSPLPLPPSHRPAPPSGDADTLSTTADVELLKGQLPPGAVVAHHHVPEYAHLDWEIAEDAHERAYPRLLQLAAQYSS